MAGVQVDTVVVPGRESVDGKCVTQVVRAGSAAAHRALHAQPAQKAADRIRCRTHRDAVPVQSDKQCRFVRSAKGMQQFVALAKIAREHLCQVGLERHITASPLALTDM